MLSCEFKIRTKNTIRSGDMTKKRMSFLATSKITWNWIRIPHARWKHESVPKIVRRIWITAKLLDHDKLAFICLFSKNFTCTSLGGRCLALMLFVRLKMNSFTTVDISFWHLWRTRIEKKIKGLTKAELVGVKTRTEGGGEETTGKRENEGENWDFVFSFRNVKTKKERRKKQRTREK